MADVIFRTNMGDIELTLDPDKAPATCANFEKYVRIGHFDGTIFHRVIPGFVIQGGGFEPGMRQRGTNDPVENEAHNGLANKTGTVSMARTPDPHSATSQFFINVADNAFLDHKAQSQEGWGYCVFATVSGGMDVVTRIAAVATASSGMHQDVPEQDVLVNSAEMIEPE